MRSRAEVEDSIRDAIALTRAAAGNDEEALTLVGKHTGNPALVAETLARMLAAMMLAYGDSPDALTDWSRRMGLI